MEVLYLTLNNVVIDARESDKYVNATQMCKAGGKLFADWYRLDSTKRLIKSIILDLGLKTDLVDVKRGRYHSGAWIHPDLAVPLAYWVDEIFVIRVSRWIQELTTISSVSVDNQRNHFELKEMEQKWYDAEKLRLKAEGERMKAVREKEAAEKRANYLHNYNKELLTYKKFIERKETIYIVSTQNYARQGMFKIGRTKMSINQRNSGHNTSHASGDRVEIFKEFKVNDSALVERVIHQKLAGLRPAKNNEFFMAPLALLVDIVELIVHGDHEQCEKVNYIIDHIAELHTHEFNASDWVSSIPEAERSSVQQKR